jgi:hypothetical protein
MKNIYTFIFFTLIHFFAFNQKTIVVGPQNDCATKKISRNIHTSSAYLELGNSNRLKITTLQHRTYDRSRIYDQTGKVIWEWTGESRSDTWYTKEHFLNVNCSKIKVEFTQGYSDPFCNGYIKVEVIDDIQNSPQNMPEIQTSEISNISEDESDEQDFGISKITIVELGNPIYKRFTEEEMGEKLKKSLCYAVGNYIKKKEFYDSLLGIDNVMNKLAELLCLKLNIDGTKEASPMVYREIQRFMQNSRMEFFKGKTSLELIIWYGKVYLTNYKIFSQSQYDGCDSPVIEVQAYLFDHQEKSRLEDLERQAALSNGNYESGARNYCISTSSNKYILSLFDDGSKKVIYKMYDLNGNLSKTIQGVWEINNEGVYGSAYILKTSWTGLNSGMPSLRFTCQYYAGGKLQSIIDSQNRTWYECD